MSLTLSPMNLINGRALAATVRARIKKQVAQSGVQPGLAAVLIGNDPASKLYVGLKEKACAEVGIHFVRRELPATASFDEVCGTIEALNSDSTIHGILVQLPLPAHLNENEVIAAIDPAKDADGFHPTATGTPSLVAAILALVESTGEKLNGKEALVLANSFVFAKPVISELQNRGLQADYKAATDNWHTAVKNADLLVVAAGRAGLIHDTDCKPGAIVIDVGTNRVNGKIVGDVTVSENSPLGWITPVPGGVGPMTVACLLQRIASLAQRA